MNTNKGTILLAMKTGSWPEGEKRLRDAGDGRKVLLTTDAAEMEEVAAEVEIAMGDVPPSLFPKMPNLKWVQLWSAGADNLRRFPETAGLPFLLTTTSGMHRRQLTEHIFALILAWCRRLPAAFDAQKRGVWEKGTPADMVSLDGKTMLILGYGEIGEQTAIAALAFGMKVIGLRRQLAVDERTAVAEKLGVRLESAAKLTELLLDADFVVNILPHTDETERSFGAVQFAAMKKSAVYVNVGRGQTTDEAALVEALQKKRIAGALLDVTAEEPLPASSPLWRMDNVILTAHYAGFHPEYNNLALEIALENLSRYIAGKPLKNLVDRSLGY
jgi:phosphoglycerate dehydrogenase-like enzyme